MGRKQQDKDKASLSYAMSCSSIASNSLIMRAKTKPKGVSDIRWKMELRRRRNAAYYSLSGDSV